MNDVLGEECGSGIITVIIIINNNNNNNNNNKNNNPRDQARCWVNVQQGIEEPSPHGQRVPL